MSYILEAIKKADLKRKIGNVPDIHSDHDVHLSEPTQRATWPYIVAIALFFNAGLIAWWLHSPPSPTPSHIEELAKKVQTPVIPETPSKDGPLIKVDNPILTQAPPTNIIPSTHHAADTASGLAPLLDPKLPTQKVIIAATPETLSERIGEITHSLANKTAVEKAPKSNLENQLPKQTQLDDNVTNKTTENELDDITESETIAEPDRPVFDIKKVPLLYQLPESVQKDIPEIKISFHSYRYRPGSRLVRINGRIMREGKKITKDLILEKIIPSGVVLLFKNKRFRVGL